MKTMRRRIPISLATALVLWAVLVLRIAQRPPTNILSWDTFGYHLYLPAAFIHHDVSIRDTTWVQSANNTYKCTGTLYQLSLLPSGAWVNKYPMGMAMLWSPFFLGGHAVAGIVGAPQDGFSTPYRTALIVAALVYLLIGLLLLRKLLRLFFDDRVTAATLALIVLGTNYLSLAVHGTGMPHIFLFSLGIAAIWHSIGWYREGRLRHALALGFVLGLMVVSRPSEIVWCLVPLFMGLHHVPTHLNMLWQRRAQLFTMALVATAVCLPQLLYWKSLTGQWFYNSYDNPGEGFEFLHPYIGKVLFSARKGWYLYTPIMLMATLGIGLLWRRTKDLRWPVLAFFLANLYLIGSWSCWWYADSFGSRALVQSYGLMALPLGTVIVWLGRARWPLRTLGVALLLGLAGLNVFQTWQFENGLIHTSRMTWPAYRAVFGQAKAPPNWAELLLVERAYDNGPHTPNLARYRPRELARISLAEEGALGKGREFSPAFAHPWEAITAYDHVWFEVVFRVLRPTDATTPLVTVVTTFEHEGGSYAYQARNVQWDGTPPGARQEMRVWYMSPEVRRPSDVFKTYCWLRDTLPVRIEELSITLHEPIQRP
jgi:hypothetical protein